MNVLPELIAQQLAFRIRSRSRFRLAIEEITCGPFAFIRHRRLIFPPARSPPQMIERDVGHNPVKPGIKAALKSKAVQIPVNAEKAFLINIAGIFTAVD